MIKKSKWFTALILTLAIVSVGTTVSAAGPTRIVKSETPIEVLYNARKIATDVKPKMVNGTVLVPIRFVAEKLQGIIMLQGKTITVTKGGKKLQLTIGSKSAVINGKTVTLLQPATLENGRTLVPLRVISEGLGVSVRWDEVTRFVWIGNEEVPDLNDLVKPVDIKPYLDYYNGREYLLDDGLGVYTKATIVEMKDFPFQLGAITYYRFDLAYDNEKNTYIQTTTKDNVAMGATYYFLIDNQKIRTRGEAEYLRTSPKKGYHRKYHAVVSISDYQQMNINDYKSFSLKNVKYIGIRSSNRLEDGIGSVVLVKNVWR